MAIPRFCIIRFVLSYLLGFLSAGVVVAIEPLANAHSHNDYWRERPLLDALNHGFTSVEADIFLVDGQLLVGHARNELRAGRTLEALYLEPLAHRVRANSGQVFPGSERFILLIDVKTDATPTYAKLSEVLSKYAPMLTTVTRGEIRQGAVTVVVSGNRPAFEELATAEVRYAGLDGRTSDLKSDIPAHLMPMISDNWTSQFKWRGKGPMPAAERTQLREMVSKAHAAGRLVRFWATPENEALWRELQSAGVDLLNTDQLARLAAFLRLPEREQ